ncbi:Intradiol ring-cleavage dioxygenase [Mycena pura]|uniref:Intradiol ring-cleavage dioxygenase n=1 Tax=Mycena pura TaxID=153505 RepID=A0AAD6VHG6_9AGAR|nr:Intradiol ring-cleavage dioxygenase [Mycena pura]
MPYVNESVAIPTVPVQRNCSAEVAKFTNGASGSSWPLQEDLLPHHLTCVLAPETPMRDYIANPPVRTDITEGQPGVAFTVDIGVMDTTTCKPLQNVMVELWGPNAVGEYGSTFLRGATQTGSNGIAEFQTIFPGFTTGAANHLSMLVHSTSSKSSGVVHSGQLFFTDPWTGDRYINYNENKNVRMKNAADPNFAAANKNGFNSIMDTESINDDWPEGIIGYLTVGVDPTKLVA